MADIRKFASQTVSTSVVGHLPLTARKSVIPRDVVAKVQSLYFEMYPYLLKAYLYSQG